MRILPILMSAGAFALVAFPALAIQDQPFTINGVQMVCTGVGSAADNPAWKDYPVKLVFSNGAGEYESAEHVALMQGGKSVAESDCDAPWLLIKAPAGQYQVHASLGGGRDANASFSTSGSGAQATVTLAFAGEKQAPNSLPAGTPPAQ